MAEYIGRSAIAVWGSRVAGEWCFIHVSMIPEPPQARIFERLSLSSPS